MNKNRIVIPKHSKFIKIDDDYIREKDINLDQLKLQESLEGSTPLVSTKSNKWIKDEYSKQLDFKRSKALENVPIDINKGSILRVYNIITMKYVYQYNTMDMIVVVMKLYDYASKKETNYGTLFCELTDDITPSQKNIRSIDSIHKNVAFSFYSAAPSYISCDGEYRSSFATYSALAIAKLRHNAIWSDLEEYMIRIKTRRQWSLYTSFFYPKIEQEQKNTFIEHAVKSEAAALTLLIVSWFQTIYDEMLQVTKTHINQNYKFIFLDHKDDDVAFIKSIVTKYGEAKTEQFRLELTHHTNLLSSVRELMDKNTTDEHPDYNISLDAHPPDSHATHDTDGYIDASYTIQEDPHSNENDISYDEDDEDQMKNGSISGSVTGGKPIGGDDHDDLPNTFLHCGYKMIPLNIKEVQDPVKLRYKPWREYFISNRSNDLVINSISPSFPIVLDWFYIKNSRKGLYDNRSQYERLKNSELAKNILHILYEAQRNTYFAAEDLDTIHKNPSQIKKWISGKFRKLHDKIEDPINYSIEDIIMSEVTLSFASEYVGRTVADSIILMEKSPVYNKMLGYPLTAGGYDYFAKYIFEICYGLLCANSRLGIIHGDFHLNNAAIGPLYYPPANIMENKDRKYKVVYVIDDQSQFVFPNNCYFGNIIDFSRGIINPARYDEMKDISLPATYNLVTDEDKFRVSEQSALLTLYTQMFPNKLKQYEELVVLFKNHFQAVFKLLTCIDLYMFSIRLSRILKQLEMPIYKKINELIDELNKLSERYISTEMNHLLADPVNYSKIIIDAEYPILTIIRKLFAEYIDGAKYKTIGVITDVYKLNNPISHSLAKYDTFPTYIKYANYYDDMGNMVDNIEINEYRKKNRAEYELQKNQNLEMVLYIAGRHIQKLM